MAAIKKILLQVPRADNPTHTAHYKQQLAFFVGAVGLAAQPLDCNFHDVRVAVEIDVPHHY